jgi:hypothetical protein
VAGVDFASKLPTATAPLFLLGRDRADAWVMRESNGRRAVLFYSRAAALRYARQESAGGNSRSLNVWTGSNSVPRNSVG